MEYLQEVAFFMNETSWQQESYVIITLTDIDDCVNAMCYHNGTCIDGIKDYHCNCISGYEGKQCQLGNV